MKKLFLLFAVLTANLFCQQFTYRFEGNGLTITNENEKTSKIVQANTIPEKEFYDSIATVYVEKYLLKSIKYPDEFLLNDSLKCWLIYSWIVNHITYDYDKLAVMENPRDNRNLKIDTKYFKYDVSSDF